jgi:hypothetical protein
VNALAKAISVGLILFLSSLLIVLNQATWVDHINAAITLSTTILGFALAVFGAVKTGFAVTESFGVSASQAIPAGAAASAGALVLIAGRFLAG